MLNISRPLNAGQAQTYHSREFTSAEQNYWRQGGSVVGEWQGVLAAKYGLVGGVQAAHFTKLSEGQHPQTGAQLVKHRASQEYTTERGKTVKPVEHRAGWDATFSAPKSVSLTALVGNDDRVREAHRTAVTTALVELERYTQARIGGNNQAETTGKFVVAKFEHDTARPVDGYAAPQLHTHAVIFNMTERQNGDARALQPSGLFDTQQFATAIYQSELTFQLRNLGYEIEPGRSGAPEIKGYSAEYLEASSPRSQQIRQYLEATGYQGPAAAQIAAHDTRDNKEIHSLREVVAAHRKVAAEFGNQADKVVGEAKARALTQPIERVPDAPRRAQDAVTYAKERGFEREAVSDERLLMRDALRRGMGDIRYPVIRENFDQRVSAGEFLASEQKKHATGRQFTTPETIAMEKNAVRSVRAGQGTEQPIMSAPQVAQHASAYPRLNEGQRAAIQEVLTSRDRVQGFQGLAGTGKTSSLDAIREAAERNGYAVQGFAPTSKAANQLREAGISADTLQAFLARGGQAQIAGDPASRHLYMLDESSLASTRQMKDFLNKIGPQDRVLVIGDTRQHQGVDAGKPFEQMQDAGMRTARLEQIVRQQDPALLKAVEHLSRNETATGISLLQQQGRISEIQDKGGRIAAIAKEYAARPENTIVVSPDNASRREINSAVRNELQSTRRVDAENHSLATLIPRSDLTGADRRWAAKYNPGEVIHYAKGSKEQGIEKGSYATVLSVDQKVNRLTVRREDGREVAYDPKRLQGVSVYQEINRDFAKGDRIQFTAPSRELGVANRDLATIQTIERHQVTVTMDGAKDQTVMFDTRQMRHFDHGYAVTSHSSQGATAERVLVNMDTRAHPELINTRFAYVSVSRASHEAQIYTNDAAALGQRLSHDASKSSAIDFREQQSPTQTQQEDKETNMNHTKAQRDEAMREEFAKLASRSGMPPELARKLTEDFANDLAGSRGPQLSSKELSARAEKMDHAHTTESARERVYTPAEHERHYAPLNRELHPDDAKQFGWKAETGTVQSYQHTESRRHIHIDGPTGQFFDQQKNPITQEAALDRAMGAGKHHAAQDHSQQHNAPHSDVGISL